MMYEDVIDYLQQIERYDTLINNKLREAQRWRDISMSTSVVYSDGGHGSRNVNKMADAVIRCIEIEQEINECIDLLYDAQKDVISMIEQLGTVEYDILHKVYIEYMPLKTVAREKYKSYSWARKKHEKALKDLESILIAKGVIKS